MNPLMNIVGSQRNNANKSIVEQFKEFRANFRGDPQQKINELFASGKITQQQLNQATEMAKLIKGMIRK